MYSIHNKIIKCICFKLIYSVINVDVILFFRVFNEFDFIFLLNILLIQIYKLFPFQKKEKRKMLV